MFVDTLINEAERNRPPELQNAPGEEVISPEEEKRRKWFRKRSDEGMPPYEAADIVFKAIVEDKFYILTHPEAKPMVQLRMEDILEERNPRAMSLTEDITK